MLLQPVSSTEASPKWLINGLPKSGLHMIALMIAPLANPPRDKPWYRPDWWGDLFNVWCLPFKDDAEMRGQFYKLARLQPGEYVRAHAAYRADVADFIDKCGVSHVFIYRDPRDVAISHAYHVISTDRNVEHDSKTFYRLIDHLHGFDEVLMATIEGIGGYAGTLERWEMFSPWLDCERVLSVKFEDAIADREKAARDILMYGVNRINDALELNWKLDGNAFNAGVAEMVKTSLMTEKSQTFRKGLSGEWRKEFKPQHVEAFKRHDVNDWLVKLGYEDSPDWGL